jgi:hypothetical protein
MHPLLFCLSCLQVLDHLLLLLDDGTLMVLKYSHVVQRFYIAAELQLATGGSIDLIRPLAFVLYTRVSWCG